MLDSFDNYLRSIGYGGMFALAVLSGICLAAVMFAAIIWWAKRETSRLPRCRNCGARATALTNGWCDGCMFLTPVSRR